MRKLYPTRVGKRDEPLRSDTARKRHLAPQDPVALHPAKLPDIPV